MVSKTNEQALEAAIEKSLTGFTSEEIKAGAEFIYGSGSGFYIGNPKDYNAKYAIDEVRFWHFLQNTQEEELTKLQRRPDWKQAILDRFDRIAKTHGILHILKKGLKVEDVTLIFLYPQPLASSSEAAKKNFANNEFSVTRQICYSLANPLEEIDMVIFVNGLPIATMELKNPWTGQNARYNAQHQYREDRDIQQPLLQFARCLVHMAVDTDEVYMTTKLEGRLTFFLPFNKGCNFGKGNPVNPNGHKSAYLWEEVFTRDSLANIIQHFMRLDGDSKSKLPSKTLFFPRYHQLDVVRKLINHAENEGVGHTYLIQHSAGSGKSNSITWAAFQLIETYPINTSVRGAKDIDVPLFDSVIVVTDRRLLDRQIRDNIKDFSEVKSIIAHATSSQELKDSLTGGKKIIITTIQKFPFIVEGISDLSDKNFAVIIDEAHSSQSGTAHDNMNKTMGATSEDEDTEDAQDKILKAMKDRKMRGNASYFAFTATPKSNTLEKFGIKQEDGSFKPFHLYSMKQAIEEGFILDVLSNYTTYKSYYEIIQSVDENPLFDTIKAQKKLRAYVENHKATIKSKAEVMLDHFISKVFNAKKLRGKAKGMVVTQNIEAAIKYYKALKSLLEERGNPFKILIAFSGKKEVEGIEYSEAEINGFSESKTRDKFDEDEYRLLVVSNKYLTGFDQQKLTAMYVDKKLQYVLAVQALSRLNRSCNKLGKKTEDLFVLDFFNKTDDIKEAFDPFYTATTLSEPTDVNILHDLKDHLDSTGIYEWYEVEDFTEKFFNNADAQELSPIIDTAALRFNEEFEFEDNEKADIKIKAKQFVKIYGQMAAIMPYELVEWEKLFWFLKFLIPKLVVKNPQDDAFDALLDSIDLSTYGLERTKLNQKIGLDDSETELDPQNPNLRGAHDKKKEENTLSEIVKSFNEKWFNDWSATPEEQRVKFVNLAERMKAHPDYEEKYKNNSDPQNREIAIKKIFDEVLTDQRRQEMELYKLVAKDDSAKASLLESLKRLLSA